MFKRNLQLCSRCQYLVYFKLHFIFQSNISLFLFSHSCHFHHTVCQVAAAKQVTFPSDPERTIQWRSSPDWRLKLCEWSSHQPDRLLSWPGSEEQPVLGAARHFSFRVFFFFQQKEKKQLLMFWGDVFSLFLVCCSAAFLYRYVCKKGFFFFFLIVL